MRFYPHLPAIFLEDGFGRQERSCACPRSLASVGDAHDALPLAGGQDHLYHFREWQLSSWHPHGISSGPPAGIQFATTELHIGESCAPLSA
jgi:hypothetical protein